MSDMMYDDSAKGGYSYAEKLKMIEEGLMSPTEIGLPEPDPATGEGPVEKETVVKLGTALICEAGVVPLELRALWARQEAATAAGLIVEFDTEKWIAEHKNEYRVQCKLRCGTVEGRFEQTYKDPILGLAEMLRTAAKALEVKYSETITEDAKSEESKAS